MTLKIFQLNIWKNRFLNRVIDFIKNNDFDIVCLQELSGGLIAEDKQDGFKTITEQLDYQGTFSSDVTINNQLDGYFGNAILLKKNLELFDKQIIGLNDKNINYASIDKIMWFNNISRHFVIAQIKINNTKLNIITTHLTRGPDSQDDEQKLTEAQILIDYLKKLTTPFILTGDFNIDPRSKIVQEISGFCRNLTVENNITNTLNPNIHYGKHLFPPGIPVDYIFVSNKIKVNWFKLIDSPDLSDHYGLVVEIII